MLLVSMFTLNSCDQDLWEHDVHVIYPYPGYDVERPEVNIEESVSSDITVSAVLTYVSNNVNLKCFIEDTYLEVGDTLKTRVCSENEVKHRVKMLINSEEILCTDELPAEYSCVVDTAGDLELEFRVFNEWDVCLFNEKVSVNVE